MTLQRITYSQTHVQVSEDIDFSEWMGSVSSFARLDTAWQWWLGDLLVAGENIFGEQYAQAISEEHGVNPKTATNVMIMAKKFEPARRVTGLFWSHHRAVRGIDSIEKQDEWLQVAARERLSVRALEKRIENDLAEANGNPEESFVCGDEPEFLPGNVAESTIPDSEIEEPEELTDSAIRIEGVVIDLDDDTSRRNYEKMVEELQRILTLRIPNLFLDQTEINSKLQEVFEIVSKARSQPNIVKAVNVENTAETV